MGPMRGPGGGPGWGVSRCVPAAVPGGSQGVSPAVKTFPAPEITMARQDGSSASSWKHSRISLRGWGGALVGGLAALVALEQLVGLLVAPGQN